MKVLLIDNYDSFTFNLYQYVGEILAGQQLLDPSFTFELMVKRNDEVTLEQIKHMQLDRIIISPGPGSPDDRAYFGVCSDVIAELGEVTPILGVCLGMQGIVHVLGGRVIKAPLPMHGKLSPVLHDETGVFANIPQGLDVMRYHSLVAEKSSLPDCLQITAFTQSEDASVFGDAVPDSAEIMGVRHKRYPIEGIQFHPESFASEGGIEMIRNFLFRS